VALLAMWVGAMVTDVLVDQWGGQEQVV